MSVLTRAGILNFPRDVLYRFVKTFSENFYFFAFGKNWEKSFTMVYEANHGRSRELENSFERKIFAAFHGYALQGKFLRGLSTKFSETRAKIKIILFFAN